MLLVGVPGLHLIVADGLHSAGVAALPQLACWPAAVHTPWPAAEQAPQPAKVHKAGDDRYLSSIFTAVRHQQISSSASSDKQATEQSDAHLAK